MNGLPRLDYPNSHAFVEYLYVDITRLNVCSKTKILDFEPKTVNDVPFGHCSLVSTYPVQADFDLKECIMKPVALFKDPIRGGRNKLVLCETFQDLQQPTDINTRHKLRALNAKIKNQEAWIGIEQEYVITDKNGTIPVYGPAYSRNRASFHDSINATKSAGIERCLVEHHAIACIEAGLKLHGTSNELDAGQWEYQLGPGDPLEIADQLVVSRYLLNRLAEVYGVLINFDPVSPAGTGNLFTSGLHISYSSKLMREENGLRYVEEAVEKLAEAPVDTLLPFFDRNGGKDNKKRLTGLSRTPFEKKCIIARGHKINASIRIPLEVLCNRKGYFEERRPASDCDPYTLLEAFLSEVSLPKLSIK